MSAIDFPRRSLQIRRPGPTAAVFTAPRQHDWSGLVEARAQLLAELRPGWDGGAAPAPTDRTIAVALRELRLVCPPQAPMPQVVPTVDGGVQFEWHVAGWSVEMEVTPAGEVHAWAEADGTGEGWDGSFPAVREELILTLKRLGA